jgi:hypothetical protein
MKICKWEPCSNPFNLKYPNQRYCSDECLKNARREQVYDAKFKWRIKWKMHGKTDKGTAYLGPHRDPNFGAEYDLIQKEKRKCGLI